MVNTIHRAIHILEILADNDALGVTDISRMLNLPKSSVHNIFETLEVNGIIEKDQESRKYHLGAKLIELGNRAAEKLEICKIARPYLNGLNMKFDETVHLSIRDNDKVLYVDCVESKKRLRTYSVIGIKAPLYCTGVGKAILAFLHGSEIERIIENLLRYAQATGVDGFTPSSFVGRPFSVMLCPLTSMYLKGRRGL
jgi:DNA-binding IclR family transcriptional regulator